MTPFYVTGLPRSRTSWLAMALSRGRVACLHEPLLRMEDFSTSSLRSVLEGTGAHFAGVSDSSLPILAPFFPRLVPGPVVVVRRPVPSVATSLERYLDMPPSLAARLTTLVSDRLETFASENEHLAVGYEQLSEEGILREIWEHIAPGEEYPAWWMGQVQRMRIEVDRDRILVGARPFPIEAALGLMEVM